MTHICITRSHWVNALNEKKWPFIYRRHFQRYFHETQTLYTNKNFADDSSWQYISLGSRNGSEKSGRQTFAWINNGWNWDEIFRHQNRLVTSLSIAQSSEILIYIKRIVLHHLYLISVWHNQIFKTMYTNDNINNFVFHLPFLSAKTLKGRINPSKNMTTATDLRQTIWNKSCLTKWLLWLWVASRKSDFTS